MQTKVDAETSLRWFTIDSYMQATRRWINLDHSEATAPYRKSLPEPGCARARAIKRPHTPSASSSRETRRREGFIRPVVLWQGHRLPATAIIGDDLITDLYWKMPSASCSAWQRYSSQAGSSGSPLGRGRYHQPPSDSSAIAAEISPASKREPDLSHNSSRQNTDTNRHPVLMI